MIIDPCYMNEAGRWDPKKFLDSVAKFEAEGDDHMANNMKRLAREKTELQNITANWDQYCKNCKEVDYKATEYAGGVISPTRNGDGSFPVYGVYDKGGELLRIEISFK